MKTLTENGIKVLERRYLQQDETGRIIETPEGLFRRVARAIAQAELQWGGSREADLWEARFFDLLSGLHFLPNSPTLMNAGLPAHQLSACFVLPVEDRLTEIFNSLKNAALIHQSGGGTGFNFSHLRPMHDMVSSRSGTASGPVSFMQLFDEATQHIKQGGKRRGANMGILNAEHPDIFEFIKAKDDHQMLRNFNISVGLHDAFMHALEKGGEWELIHPNSKKVVNRIPAKQLWDALLQSAWSTGDPGLIFLDTINQYNPTPALGPMEATNPCGEVPLYPYEACNLGSINLSNCVQAVDGKSAVHWELLGERIDTAIRFLDNVIEVNQYLLPEIQEITKGNRKIGLGVMGWAELLIQLQLPYDSDAAVQLAGELMRFVQLRAFSASQELAKQRGVFPNWSQSIYAPDQPVRHATRSSIAPTGTISIIAGCSSSIEPLFALAYRREHVLNDESLLSVNPLFIEQLEKSGFHHDAIMQQVMESGMISQIAELPETLKAVFKTALEIAPEWHIQHQIAFQRYTDNAVSKT
ncbi:MAG TPA: adenosylcobalamin-dependent ribonucleoside-diphosphate reductase, partial [Saprospiraceae bacterium]|nr:adenosylcobalamin-dependent ribonucleoside-diphosphate reductase [Saprospiraceae bacterium]